MMPRGGHSQNEHCRGLIAIGTPLALYLHSPCSIDTELENSHRTLA